MSVQGILLIDLVALVLLAAIVNLVRTHRLHAGFGILWIFALLALMAMVSFPPLLALVTRLVGAVFPASALTLLAFVFIFAVLIYFSVRISSLSAQHAELVQALALRELQERSSKPRTPGSVGEESAGAPGEAGSAGAPGEAGSADGAPESW